MENIEIFIVALCLSNVFLSLWLLRKIQKPVNQNEENVVNRVLAGIGQSNLQFFGQLIDKLNQNNLDQNKEMGLNWQNLEKRFTEIQLKIVSSLNDELSKVHTIQTSNKEAIQVQLSTAIQNLIDLNKSELKSIQDVNRQNFDILNKTNTDKLIQIQTEIDKRLNENLSQNLKSFENVTKNLTQMQDVAQRMIDSTSSIDKLNNIFERTSSKSFGDFGEKYLESLLNEYLNAKNWAKQVLVPNSQDKIDFVIYIGEKAIGIDSKFPVTKYNDFIESETENKKQSLAMFLRTVTQMAGEIHQKYHKANFLDTILIYLPSDGMYFEVSNHAQTMESLHKFKVTLASPSTIVPLLALIQQYEFKITIQDRADDIIKGLNKVKKNVESFRDEFRKLGDKLRQAQQNYESADKNLLIVQDTVLKLEGGEE